MVLFWSIMLVTCLADLSNWQQASPCVERGLTFCTSFSLFAPQLVADLSNWHLRPCNQCNALCLQPKRHSGEKRNKCNQCGKRLQLALLLTQWRKDKEMQPVWKEVALLLTNHMHLCDNCALTALCVWNVSSSAGYSLLAWYAWSMPTKPTVCMQIA